MKPPIVLKIWLLLLLLQFGCAPQNVEEENIYYVAKIFNEEYDEVWDTLRQRKRNYSNGLDFRSQITRYLEMVCKGFARQKRQ